MPKLTENEIIVVCAKITAATGHQVLDISVEPHDNESERSYIQFTSANYSSARKDSGMFEDHMREHNDNHVLFIPLGARAFIVSNDLLRKVFCE